jgi:hypothetical protein
VALCVTILQELTQSYTEETQRATEKKIRNQSSL